MDKNENLKEIDKAAAISKPRQSSNLNPDYVFKSFIVGKSNQQCARGQLCRGGNSGGRCIVLVTAEL